MNLRGDERTKNKTSKSKNWTILVYFVFEFELYPTCGKSLCFGQVYTTTLNRANYNGNEDLFHYQFLESKFCYLNFYLNFIYNLSFEAEEKLLSEE